MTHRRSSGRAAPFAEGRWILQGSRYNPCSHHNLRCCRRLGSLRELLYLKSLLVKTPILRALVFVALVLGADPASTVAQTTGQASDQLDAQEICRIRAEGSALLDPPALRSQNGLLQINLSLLNFVDSEGGMRYCYVDEHGNVAPTLRLRVGDTLILALKNEISLPSQTSGRHPRKPWSPGKASADRRKADPCAGGAMTPSTTNLHFHGLIIPPYCHQDETLKTMIQPGDPPFEYRFKIPENQPPGLYWYHPHSHGFSEAQVLGGASGALIIEGIERVSRQVAGLPERLLIIRDQEMPRVSASEKPDPMRPTKQLTVNFVPVPYPQYPPAVISLRPSERQFWRVLNASADTYIDLSVIFENKLQTLGIISLDGVPLRYDAESSNDYLLPQSHVLLPPAGRAEFILNGPPKGVQGLLVTRNVFRGAADDDGTPIPVDKNANSGARVGQDDIDPPRPVARIIATTDLNDPRSVLPQASSPAAKSGLAPLSTVPPVRTRTLYFSERLTDSTDPNSTTVFFITEEGHKPAPFDPTSGVPNIVVHQGDVEDWFVENRSLESHTFHIHQMHFLVVGVRDVAYEAPALRDTVNLPAWDGFSRLFPRVKLRMDFRNPRIVGTFPFHCHIMQHVDGGMMGTVRVEPTPEH
jgi:FtsP/CotA-like multicopper oxidase with cupredoxin domain